MSLLPFWALNMVVALLSNFIKQILICVPNMNKVLKGLERYEGE